jgi:stage V sporulation protein G
MMKKGQDKKMEIKLSEIQITPVKPKDGLTAFVTFVLNNSFFIGDVAIYSRLDGDGYRLVYPTKVLQNGLKVNCFHPINRQSAQAIEEQVIKVFEELSEKAKMRKGINYELETKA